MSGPAVPTDDAPAAIDEIQRDIIDEFALFDQWLDRYEYIIELGSKLPPMAADYKTADRLIPGCQSQVWLHAEAEADCIRFSADSDAVITKGIIALLIRVLSRQPAAAVASAELFFIDAIGLRQHLSSGRSNGLVSMLRQMQGMARALQPAPVPSCRA